MQLDGLATGLDPILISLAAAGGTLLVLILVVSNWISQRRLLKRYRRLLYGPKAADLETLLLGQAATIDALRDRVEQTERALEAQAESLLGHVQYLGVVRFQAFPEAGGDLSFSLALMDANRNGVVITSLYGRSESRVYAKPLTGGTSTYSLSEEEQAAIAAALKKSKIT